MMLSSAPSLHTKAILLQRKTKKVIFGILISGNFECSSQDGQSDVFVGHENQCLECFEHALWRQAKLDDPELNY